MSSIEQSMLLSVLHAYVPAEFARNMLQRAFERCGIVGTEVPAQEVDRVLSAVQIGVQLFVEPEHQPAVHAALAELAGPSPDCHEANLKIETPADVASARAEARRITQRLGARSLITQRVSSVVSELGQNILLHASVGILEIQGQRRDPRLVLIVARDAGRGIADLDAVLRGDRGRGYGLGLSGIKKSADRFHVHTDARGTHVEVQVFV